MKTLSTLEEIQCQESVFRENRNLSNGTVFRTSIPRFLGGVIVLALGSSALTHAQNLLINGHFERRASVQTIQENSCSGSSSATDWTTWINATICVPGSGAELETDMLLSPSPLPIVPGAHLIHVRTTVVDPNAASQIRASGADAGLVQVFGAYGTGPSRVLESVWVYVIRGQVGIGVGNGGDTSISATSSTHGQWEHLISRNANSPANEFILYSTDPNGSEFYADDAVVCNADNFIEIYRCRELIAE